MEMGAALESVGGLFKCMRLNKVFNADLVAAYNILVMLITLSPERGKCNGPETRPGIKPSKRGGVIPNLSYNGRRLEIQKSPLPFNTVETPSP